MKKIFIFLIALIIAVPFYGQSDDVHIQNLMKEGTRLHDEGNYDGAIAKYNEVLALKPNYASAIYEISFSLYAKKDYKGAEKYSKELIDGNYDVNFQRVAYNQLGSIYDDWGKHKDAIKIYKQGLEKFPDFALMHFNLALTYSRENETEKSLEEVSKALELNLFHPGSNHLLSKLMAQKGKRVQAILPLYVSLFANPSSPYAEEDAKMLINLVFSGVSKDQTSSSSDKDKVTVTVNLSPNSLENSGGNDNFSSVNTMLLLNAAARYAKEFKDMSDAAFFSLNTTDVLFESIAETGSTYSKLWQNYVDFVKKVAKSGNSEAFSYYIIQSAYPKECSEWENKNKDKFNKFASWVKEEFGAE